MQNKKIAIGSDHGGFEYKAVICEYLKSEGYEVLDKGTFNNESCDYPEFAKKVCESIISNEVDKGILICGTGIGMSISANKYKGIRASLCNETYSAKMTRAHNNSNVLCLGARVIGEALAIEIVKTWLETDFEGGRHQRRIDMIEKEEI